MRSTMRKLGSVLLALLVLACVPLAAALAAAEERPVLYISGAPSLGMVEYYDLRAEQYRGYVPALLHAFSEEYGYDLRYLSVGGDDRRFEKLNNIQADLVTAASTEDFYTREQWADGITILSAEQNGKSVEYRLLFTAATGSSLKARLAAFVAAYPAERTDGLLLEVWEERGEAATPVVWIAAAGVALLLAITLLLVMLRLKRKLKENSRGMETDPVTGIGNDIYLHNCFSERISDRNRALYSAIYFRLGYDTPSAKEVAESQNGALQYIADLLRENTQPEDILARVDEKGFLVLRLSTDQEETGEWVQRMLLQIDAFLGRTPQSDWVYAGVVPLQTSDRDLDSVIFNAAYSSRYAKKSGSRSAEYSHSVVDSMKEEYELRMALGQAFAEDQFILYLQLIVDGRNGAVLGAEALSRWNHPTKGRLSPGKYIDLIETENRSAQFDFMIFEKVCALLEEVCASEASFFISCNFMRTTIVLPDFVERFKGVLERYRFPRECLLFEITEYSVVEDRAQLYRNVERVRALGVRIVIDDFGNGNSDVFDLGHFPADGVKLDRILVAGNTTEQDDIILAGMLRIFAELKMAVIAEGIEHQEHADRLLRLGCTTFQGYYYYLPMPTSEARRLIEKG